uniref:General transcription factor IIH subunit 4 n=1 Tax=Caenorhabditis japonica TaxID=281687 RepID=A0A8R1EJS2_CAEJA
MTSAPPGGANVLTTSANSCLFLDFLITVPAEHRQRMLQRPSCALFIYRMLPPMAQQITVQLIWKGSFPKADDVEETKSIEGQLKLLEELGIVRRKSGKLVIDEDYKRSFMYAAMLGATQISSLVMETNDDKRRGKDVEKKAVERWDCILRNKNARIRDIWERCDRHFTGSAARAVCVS